MACALSIVPFQGVLDPYNVSIIPYPSSSRLILTVEHRLTKRFFRLEILEDEIPSLTQGLHQTCNQLFNFLCQIIAFLPMDPDKYVLKLTEHHDIININIGYTVYHPKIGRQYNMIFQVLHVRNFTRLETKFNDQNQQLSECIRCIDQLTLNENFERYDQAARFHPWTTLRLFGREYIPSNDYRTVTNHSLDLSNSILAISSHPFYIPTNQRYIKISFLTHVAFLYNKTKLPTILIGIFWKNNIDQMNIIAPLEYKHAWWFSVHSGRTLNTCLGCRDYAWQVEEFDCLNEKSLPYRHRVDILFDTIKRRVAFQVDNQDTQTWAFYLPDHINIDQLYPIVFIDGYGCSVTIDP